MTDNQEQLTKRVKQLENELAAMKLQLNKMEEKIDEQSNKDAFGLLYTSSKAQTKKPVKQVEKQPNIKKHHDIKHDPSPIESVISEKAFAEQDYATKEPINFEQILSTWLPRVFMIILILGILWGLKIGMDNGWISYEVRIALGYITSIALYFLGKNSIKKKHPLFGVTLFGGLIAIGILVTMAAYYLYDLFPYPLAFIIGLLYIAFGLWMSKRIASETLTILSGIAGFLLPYLIVGSSAHVWTFCLYMLILFLSLFYIAIRSQHKISYMVTFVLFQLSLLTYTLVGLQTNEEWYIVGTVLIQHAVFLYFYLRGRIARHIFAETTIYVNVVCLIGWISLLENNMNTVVYGLLALAYISFAFYTYTKKIRNYKASF